MDRDTDKESDTETPDNKDRSQDVPENERDNPLALCEQKRDEYLAGWQRTQADFHNYRKAEGERLEDLARFVTEGLLNDLLPVLDSFELALSHGVSPELERGVLLIRLQLLELFKRRGVEEIMVQKGDRFNPEFHESVGVEEGGDAQSGSVSAVIQKGYVRKGKIIRPARVKLVK